MKARSKKFLKEILAAMSPSGHETEAAAVWRKEAKSFADEVYGDTKGNSFAVVNPKGSPTIMLAGHIDEIGLAVTHIDDQGYIFFSPIGGWDAQILAGQRVRVSAKGKATLGVIGRKPIHQMNDDERKKALKLEDLWIDMGFKDKKEAQKHVDLGDPIVLEQGYEEVFGNNIVSRGIDDRIGAFIVLEALRELAGRKPKARVVAVATVQEEIGHYGATVSAYGLDPGAAIAVDVGHATDIPNADKRRTGEHPLGSGPIVSRGAMINPKLFKLVAKTAEEDKIPHTLRSTAARTFTDTDGISISRLGVPSALISVPNRYMHSPNEMVNLEDVVNCIKLIAATCEKITPKTDFIP